MEIFCKFLLGIFLFSTGISFMESARILAYIPSPYYSHQSFYQQLWRQLALRGHDMTVITTDPTGEHLSNLREISIRESYALTEDVNSVMVNQSIIQMLFRANMTKMVIALTEHVLSLPQIQNLLSNASEHFDLLFVEHMNPILLGLKYKYNCPCIGVMTMDAFPISHRAMGNPTHSVLYPMAFFSPHVESTLWDRLLMFFVPLLFDALAMFMEKDSNDIIRRYFHNDAPGMLELLDETDMLFINANPIFTKVRPLTPSTISLHGGINIKPPTPLPNGLQRFFDEAHQGAIYLSLGSIVKSSELTSELRRTIIAALSNVSYSVLWKYEDDSLTDLPKNVKIVKWAPQQDVLRHNNIKLFITHGGLQSCEEALYFQIPMVVIPFFGDQIANAHTIQTLKMGIFLDRYTLRAEELVNAINEVITNKEYKTRLEYLSNIIQDVPMKPMEKAIWWTEYVLRHKGAKHLKGPTIPFYQYYFLDVIVVLLIALLLLIGILIGIFYAFYKLFRKVTCKTGSAKVKLS